MKIIKVEWAYDPSYDCTKEYHLLYKFLWDNWSRICANLKIDAQYGFPIHFLYLDTDEWVFSVAHPWETGETYDSFRDVVACIGIQVLS